MSKRNMDFKCSVIFTDAFPVYRGRYVNNRIEYRKVNVHNYIVIYKILEDKKEIIIMSIIFGTSLSYEMFNKKIS